MTLAGVVLELVAVVGTMLAAATLVVVGPRRFLAALGDFRWRLRRIAVPAAAVLVVLGVRWATSDVTPLLSWRLVGVNVTSDIYRLESALFATNPVTALQSLRTEALTSFFVFAYLYAYPFVLAFPIVAYAALDRMDHLRTLLLSYAANYGIGLVCYVIFIAFGPRNYDPLLFEGLLYDAYPQARRLTDGVNQYTNVFPSLHTSLSVTVALVAWHTREEYPLWAPIAAVLGASIVVSTMYLGIHWLTDVVAGTALAVVSVAVGRRYSIEGATRTLRAYVADRTDRPGNPGD